MHSWIMNKCLHSISISTAFSRKQSTENVRCRRHFDLKIDILNWPPNLCRRTTAQAQELWIDWIWMPAIDQHKNVQLHAHLIRARWQNDLCGTPKTRMQNEFHFGVYFGIFTLEAVWSERSAIYLQFSLAICRARTCVRCSNLLDMFVR